MPSRLPRSNPLQSRVDDVHRDQRGGVDVCAPRERDLVDRKLLDRTEPKCATVRLHPHLARLEESDASRSRRRCGECPHDVVLDQRGVAGRRRSWEQGKHFVESPLLNPQPSPPRAALPARVRRA
jgi:hypothetical protein